MSNIVTQHAMTMTSQEIAELVESRHDDVKRSIERLANRGVIVQPPMADEPGTDAMGRLRTTRIYRFCGEQGKRDSIIVVAQLSPEFTARLVDRWQELEKEVAQPQPLQLSRLEILQIAMESEQARIKAESERDDAIRTKALIGNKREATAMATASAAKRVADRLRQQLGRNQHHATIIAVEQVTGLKFAKNAYVGLRRWCKTKGVSPVEVVDERYGSVKAWPAGAWLDVYDIDLATLFGALVGEDFRLSSSKGAVR